MDFIIILVASVTMIFFAWFASKLGNLFLALTQYGGVAFMNIFKSDEERGFLGNRLDAAGLARMLWVTVAVQMISFLILAWIGNVFTLIFAGICLGLAAGYMLVIPHVMRREDKLRRSCVGDVPDVYEFYIQSGDEFIKENGWLNRAIANLWPYAKSGLEAQKKAELESKMKQ